MNVWLIHPGELLPVVDEHPRLFRYSYLAEGLCEKGHRVIRFAPTFAHATKSLRALADRVVQVNEQYEIHLLHAGTYYSHRSLQRYLFYKALAKKFAQHARTLNKPDVIVCGIPTLELCEESVALGREWRVPVVIDVRDLWPDVYLNLLPRKFRPIGRWLLTPMFDRTSKMLQLATGRVAVSRTYLEWACGHIGQPPGVNDAIIYLGSESIPEETPDDDWLRSLGVDRQKLLVCFAGQFEKNYDIGTILEAARIVDDSNLPIQFVMAGKGQATSVVSDASRRFKSVAHVGWLNKKELAAILHIADVGLCSYSRDALQSLPNKPFEYMAAGMAIANSLVGELGELVSKHELGVNYLPGNAIDMVAALQLLLDEVKLRECKVRSRGLFNSSFNHRDTAGEYVAYLERLTG